MYTEKAERLVKLLKERGLTIAAAESCTGGKVSDLIVSVPGASEVFKEGFITYCNEAKIRSLGVDKAVIAKTGAISDETARLMARGAAKKAETDIGLSATGNAGPSADEGKPVGLVYIGCFTGKQTLTEKLLLEGDRETIRSKAAESLIELAIKALLQS